MEMLVMGLALSLIGVTVSAALFAAATHETPPPEAPRPRPSPPLGAPAFFVAHPAAARPAAVDVLLLEIERHVRLEHAAAEAFLASPTRDALHSRTGSPLVH